MAKDGIDIADVKGQTNSRVIHSLIFVLLMVGTISIPPFRHWPWIWVLPLAGYFLTPIIIARLRSSIAWFRFGKVTGASIAATVVIMALASVTLVAFNAIWRPDLSSYQAALRLEMFGGVITAGVIFTVVNASLEELVFRGVLFDAVRSQWNLWVTLSATSLLFGIGHLHGFPPGVAGVSLAVIFGFAMGVLRVWTDGLALPVVAHMGADATIYCILIRSGAI
jgi:membrane protease YdiL (CAAX protease family)